MQQGWIKLHRSLLENALFDDADMLKLWVLCLFKATHKPKKVLIEKQLIPLEPGQFVTGRFALAAEFNEGAPPKKRATPISLYRWLNKLQTWQKVNIKTTSKYSIITILNWHEYQQNEQQMNNRRTTDEQQMNTNKNVKNVKNKDLASSDDLKEHFDKFWEAYPRHVNPTQTLRNYKSLRKTVDHETIMRACKNYVQDVELNNTPVQYIIAPANFLGQQKRYEEYLKGPEQTADDEVQTYRRSLYEGGEQP